MTATPLILVFIVSADKPKLFNSGGLVVSAQSIGQLSSVSGPPQIPSPQHGFPGGTSLQLGTPPPPPPPVLSKSPLRHLVEGKLSINKLFD